MNREDPIDFLLSMSRSEYLGMKPGLGRIRELLQRLGNPERSFPAVLIGGSNGKGSTAVILAGLLSRLRSGTGKPLRLGLYLSPHLVCLEERILVNGRPIPRARLRRITRKLLSGEEPEKERDRWTFFEFITAAAFEYFREEKVDLAVVEVGMGGRLDATNVLKPLAAVITNISREHTEWLGNSLREIAREKAGIIKEGGKVVTGSRGEAREEIERIAGQKSAQLYCLDRDFRIEPQGRRGLTYQGLGFSLDRIKPSGGARYQIPNMALALSTLEIVSGLLGIRLVKRDVRAGLKGFYIPGRFHLVKNNGTIVLDGAHNPGAAKILAEEMRRVFPGRKATLIFTAMRDKKADQVLDELLPLASRIILVDLGGKRAFAPAEIQEIIRAKDKEISIDRASGVKQALKLARNGVGKKEPILVTGSLYLVGEVLRVLRLPGWVRFGIKEDKQ